jgi:hypothetical protein
MSQNDGEVRYFESVTEHAGTTRRSRFGLELGGNKTMD